MRWRARTAAVHLAMVLVALLFATAASAYTLKFPAHGEDLPYGHYWYTSIVHAGSGNAHDLVGIRYDFTTGSWHDELPTGSDLAASILFGQPIYAAADGEIVSCWREYPDWPAGNAGRRGMKTRRMCIARPSSEITFRFAPTMAIW